MKRPDIGESAVAEIARLKDRRNQDYALLMDAVERLQDLVLLLGEDNIRMNKRLENLERKTNQL